MTYFLYGLALVLLLSPLAVWIIRFTKRQRGGAVLLTGLLLVFGMNMQITPPPPPQTELVQRQADDDEPKGCAGVPLNLRHPGFRGTRKTGTHERHG